MGYTKEEIARILSETRQAAGFTQQQAAGRINRNRQTLASWETGKSQPDANTLFELFDLYETSIEEAFCLSKKASSLSPMEQALIAAFRRLPESTRASLVQFVADTARAANARSRQGAKPAEDAALALALARMTPPSYFLEENPEENPE